LITHCLGEMTDRESKSNAKVKGNAIWKDVTIVTSTQLFNRDNAQSRCWFFAINGETFSFGGERFSPRGRGLTALGSQAALGRATLASVSFSDSSR
jgi:hypothetical protein